MCSSYVYYCLAWYLLVRKLRVFNLCSNLSHFLQLAGGAGVDSLHLLWSLLIGIPYSSVWIPSPIEPIKSRPTWYWWDLWFVSSSWEVMLFGWVSWGHRHSCYIIMPHIGSCNNIYFLFQYEYINFSWKEIWIIILNWDLLAVPNQGTKLLVFK